jgi:hypothetical protein
MRGTGGTSAALADLLGAEAPVPAEEDLGHGITTAPAPPLLAALDIPDDEGRIVDLTDRALAEHGRHRRTGPHRLPEERLLLAAVGLRHLGCGGWTGSSTTDPRWRCLECGRVPADHERQTAWVDVALTEAPVPRAIPVPEEPRVGSSASAA